MPARAASSMTGQGVSSRSSHSSAAGPWSPRAQLPAAPFFYEYARRADTRSPDDNVIRQAGALLSLYQLAANGRLDGLPTAERARAYAQANLLRHDDWAALAPPGQD